MAFRPDILAGRAVILVNIEDTIDKQLRGIRTKLRRFSNSMSDIGGDFFRGGTVGVLGAIFPVKEFIEFQDQLLFIQTKLQATDVEMLGLEQTIRDLGKSTSFTSTEVGKAAQKLAQAGFSLAETQETLQAALDLSRGGQVDLSTSTDILANNIRTYNIATADAAEVSSKFITAARLGTLDIVDLNEAIKNSATTFRLLGLDLSTSLALITRLSTASLRGTIAGTSLNRAFQKLASENKKLADVGITLAEDDLKNPLQILTKIEEVLANLNETEGVTFLNKLLGIRGGRGLGGILIQGLGPLDDQIKQISGSMDEARESADKLDSRLGGVLRRGVSSFQEFLLAAGGTSEGPLSKFGESLRQAFNALSSLATSNPEALQTIFLLPPAILAAGAAFLTFGFILNKVASAITPLISLNGLLFSSIQKVIGGNLEGLQRGKSLGKSLGLGKGLSSLGKKGPSFDLSSKLNASIKIATSNKNLRNPLRFFALKFVATLEKVFKTVTSGRRLSLILFNPLLKSIEKFSGGGRLLVGIRKVFRSIFSVNYLSKIINLVKGLGTGLRLLGVGLRGLFRFNTIFLIIEALILLGPKIPPIRDFFEKVGTFFKDIASINVGGPLSKMWEGLKNIFGGQFDQGVTKLKDGILDLIDTISIGLVNAWNKFRLSIDNVVMKLKEVGSGVLQIADALLQAVGAVGGVAFGSLTRGIGNLSGEGESVFSTQNLQDFFNGVLGLIKFIADKFIDFIGLIAKIASLIQTGIAALLRGLSLLPGGDAVAPIANSLDKNAGRRRVVKDSIQGESTTLQFQQDKLDNLLRTNLFGLLDGAIEEQRKRIGATKQRIAKLQAELKTLGFDPGTFAFDAAAARETLNLIPGIDITQSPFKPTDPGTLSERQAEREFGGIEGGVKLPEFAQMLTPGLENFGNAVLNPKTTFWEEGVNEFGEQWFGDQIPRNSLNPDYQGDGADPELFFKEFKEKPVVLEDPTFDVRPDALVNRDPGLQALDRANLALEMKKKREEAIPEEAKTQLEDISRAIASTVGSFANTRGQLLKVGQTKDKLDKERNATLKNIEKKVETGVFL